MTAPDAHNAKVQGQLPCVFGFCLCFLPLVVSIQVLKSTGLGLPQLSRATCPLRTNLCDERTSAPCLIKHTLQTRIATQRWGRAHTPEVTESRSSCPALVLLQTRSGRGQMSYRWMWGDPCTNTCRTCTCAALHSSGAQPWGLPGPHCKEKDGLGPHIEDPHTNDSA